jgi:hypothetical protein
MQREKQLSVIHTQASQLGLIPPTPPMVLPAVFPRIVVIQVRERPAFFPFIYMSSPPVACRPYGAATCFYGVSRLGDSATLPPPSLCSWWGLKLSLSLYTA